MNFKKHANKATFIIVILSIVAVVVIFASLLLTSTNNYSESYFYSMNTYVEMIADNEVKDDVKQIFLDTEKIFDNHNSGSEVSKLNKNESITATDKLTNALTRIKKLNSLYGNSADITVGNLTSLWNLNGDNFTVPSDTDINNALKSVSYENITINNNAISLENNATLDFGCVAKGIALDYVKDLLDNNHSEEAVISAGNSSILLYGDGEFTTNILSPENEDILGKIKTPQGFVSTSGGYHRYAEKDGKKYMHIIDTGTGKPSETDLTSVTVYCQSGLDSDFLSTMIFADGTENLSKYLKADDFKIVAADKDKNLYVSEGLDFELTDDSFKINEKN